MSHTGGGEQVCQRRTGAEGHTVAALADVLGVKPLDIIGTSIEQEMDTAVRFIVRNIDKLTEAQRAELIAALSKL